MQTKQSLALLVLTLGMLFAAGCGKKANNSPVGATLAGTDIPTVSPVPPTAAVCTPPELLTLPANFPSDIPIDPNRVVFSIRTQPYLQVIVRVTPPVDPAVNEPPHGVAADAVLQRLNQAGWKAQLNPRINGIDVNLTNPDGRVLHFHSIPRPDCPGVVELTYDVQWIKP